MTLHTGDKRRINALHVSDIITAARAAFNADEALYAAVADARAQGVSWHLIGLALGTSRQAAQQRFSKPLQHQPLVMPPPCVCNEYYCKIACPACSARRPEEHCPTCRCEECESA